MRHHHFHTPREWVIVMVETRASQHRWKAARRREGELRIRAVDPRTGDAAGAAFVIRGPHGYVGWIAPQNSAAPGWSRSERLPAGRYDVVLDGFTCGGELVFTDSAWAADHPVVRDVRVRARRTTRIEVRLPAAPVPGDSADLRACAGQG